jgi:hypothetical protein
MSCSTLRADGEHDDQAGRGSARTARFARVSPTLAQVAFGGAAADQTPPTRK